jgi:hypothetical protein
MSSRKKKPQWWQLYAMLPLLVGAFLLEIGLGLTGAANIVAQLGILFLFYGLVHAWLGANQGALMERDGEEGRWRVRVYEIPASELPTAQEIRKRLGEHPALQLPEAGVRGMLSTTFEIDELEDELLYPDELFKKKDAKV